MNTRFNNLRSRIIVSHLILTIFCIISLSAGFIFFMREYFGSFLSNLQTVLDNNHGQIPKGQVISTLDIAQEYVHLMNLGIIIGAILSFFAAVIVGVFMANILCKPLIMFTKAIQQLKANNYERIQAPYTGELEALKEAYNDLSDNLQELQVIRTELILNVSHELKTPLTALQGYVEGLEDNIITFDKKLAMEMEKEISRLRSLVKDFETSTLDYKATLQPSAVNVHEFFDDFYGYFLPVAIDNKISLKVLHDKNNYFSVFDSDRIRQVLVILFDNAIKYTPPSGTITISYRKECDFLYIYFEDTGCGISEDDLPYIFERFFRGEKSRSRKTGGTGIGLSIAREIAHAHGGRMGVSSLLGKGSQFWFCIPIE